MALGRVLSRLPESRFVVDTPISVLQIVPRIVPSWETLVNLWKTHLHTPHLQDVFRPSQPGSGNLGFQHTPNVGCPRAARAPGQRLPLRRGAPRAAAGRVGAAAGTGRGDAALNAPSPCALSSSCIPPRMRSLSCPHPRRGVGANVSPTHTLCRGVFSRPLATSAFPPRVLTRTNMWKLPCLHVRDCTITFSLDIRPRAV